MNWAFLSARPITWSGDGLRFAGTAGAVRKAGDVFEVIFMAAGEATVAGRTIVAKQPMRRTVAAER